ncbi:ATP-binding protein [Rhizobium sp. DKSPLA3]|uniref:ATP-binding protein n=1 Tax=Rhizobium quercicola TaxID=2901226 RepID=A0A9X1T2H7_9HYPH|nr:ATP-binding protein [Rhizobium quercicola]MCD7111806.1 ATP-binding protein [Rhizobium quercicola]
MNTPVQKNTFKSRARLLQHLGDQLIGTPRLAVFELVKNAYDADASRVDVYIKGIGTKRPSIEVVDDGTGMSLKTIQDIWLVIAHDHKEKTLQQRSRTVKGRLPLGSKGLGRLSVHKLGNRIELVTRAAGKKEVVVRIDWNEMMSHEFLDDAEIDIEIRDPEVFTNKRTGTKITIDELREQRWTRGEVRRLYRQVTSISSPFSSRGRADFKAMLHVPDYPQWIQRLPDPIELLKRAPWRFVFKFDGNNFSYQYNFRPIPGIAREAREVKQEVGHLLIPPPPAEDDDPLFSGNVPTTRMKKVVADTEMLRGIGPVSGEFYVFDLSPLIAKRMGETKLIRDFLDENGGIRVYRDDIRVYDYGERNNDWLGLDLRRVNNPTKGLSRNIVVGHVSISQEGSDALVEKSNREGFIENAAYEVFQRIVLGAIEPLQREREVDRKAIRELLGEAKDPESRSIMEPVAKIRSIASRKGLSAEIDPLLDRIELEYSSMKERLLTTGISGTSLAVVFHEIEQGIKSLYGNLENQPNLSAVAGQVREMMGLLDGFSDLLRKKDRKATDLRNLVVRARDLSLIRFRHHNVRLVCPPLQDTFPPVMVSCSFGLTLGALTNLIDNAIFWLRVRWPDESGSPKRAIYINIETDFEGGPAIVIADNGPGFQDTASELVRPFYTRRPEGMGMGLYYANMVMELNDGALVFPDQSETSIPSTFDGAIVALRFADIRE